MAKMCKERNFDSKLYSGHLEELSVVLKERFAVPCLVFHINPFNTLGGQLLCQSCKSYAQRKC
jgi:hypothetical protein